MEGGRQRFGREGGKEGCREEGRQVVIYRGRKGLGAKDGGVGGREGGRQEVR